MQGLVNDGKSSRSRVKGSDVSQPIIGADFLLQHKLLVDLDSQRLIDTRNGARVEAESSPDPTPHLNFLSVPQLVKISRLAGVGARNRGLTVENRKC